MTTILIDDETAKIIRKLEIKAREHHVSMDEYLQRLLAIAEDFEASAAPKVSGEQFEKLLDELNDGTSPAVSLPTDFSRADIYNDHD